MMEHYLREKNIEALRITNRGLASLLASVSTTTEGNSFRYSGTATAKNGSTVPLYFDGSQANSLFDPEREAANLIGTLNGSSFVFFAGIGGGFHILEFLKVFPETACIVAESGINALSSLIDIVDISRILADSRVTVIPDCTEKTVSEALGQHYIPSLFGNFRLLPLRSWETKNERAYGILAESVRAALDRISSDYSVQAHFGKLWFRNCALNLEQAAQFQGSMPQVDTGKKAIIAAAGPGLENALERIRRERNDLVIFSTDTAWNTLADSSIVPDFLVSIDAQSVSSGHVMRAFTAGMTVILDICGNPAIARKAHDDGAKVIFAAGGHPLARYAAQFAPLPILDTDSGTVTISALGAALALGFVRMEIPGADFAYVGGKPYARGTYLAHSFGCGSNRVRPAESLYAALMFRTPVTREDDGHGITYSTETLTRYSAALSSYRCETRWKPQDFAPFPSVDFFRHYRLKLESALASNERYTPLVFTLLPLTAWHSLRCERGHGAAQNSLTGVIKLALDLIARYTG